MIASILTILLVLAPPLAQRSIAPVATDVGNALPGVLTLSAEEGPAGVITVRGRIEKFQFLQGPASDRPGDREFREGGHYSFSVITSSTRTGMVTFTPFDGGHAGIYERQITLEAAGPYEYRFVFSPSGSTTYVEARTLSR